MQTSQNGWPVLASTSPKLHTWVIPARTGYVRLRLRNGSAGFLLAHFLLWFAETIEPLKGRVLDDWGWAPLRPIRDSLPPATRNEAFSIAAPPSPGISRAPSNKTTGAWESLPPVAGPVEQPPATTTKTAITKKL